MIKFHYANLVVPPLLAEVVEQPVIRRRGYDLPHFVKVL